MPVAPVTLQRLSDAGLNPFAATLLAESLLKHPNPKPVEFTLPITRGDCPGYIGVRFRLEPIEGRPGQEAK